MTTKGDSTFHKAPELEPHLQIKFRVILRAPTGGGVEVLPFCSECCWCILGPNRSVEFMLKYEY